MDTITTLFNKYRPQTLDEIIGQETAITAIKSDLTNNKTNATYLFSGTRGIGKTTLARVLAKTILCTNKKDPTTPCNNCSSCKNMNTKNNLNYMELDAASNRGINEIRTIIKWLETPSPTNTNKIVTIDETHLLTKEAVSALLKTTEEPPPNTTIILCTTQPNKIPITIQSRCKKIPLNTLTPETIENRLKQITQQENYTLENPNTLSPLAQQAQGSMRDALTLLETTLALTPENIITNKQIQLTTQNITPQSQKTINAFTQKNLQETLLTQPENLTQTELTNLIKNILTTLNNALLTQQKIPTPTPPTPQEQTIANTWTPQEITTTTQTITNTYNQYTNTPLLTPNQTYNLIITQALTTPPPTKNTNQEKLDTLININKQTLKYLIDMSSKFNTIAPTAR